MLLTQDTLGVLVSAEIGRRLSGPDGIRLGDLGRLQWIRFARSNCPNWYGEITAVLRSHGIDVDHAASDELLPITTSVVFAAVSGGRSFALAPDSWANPIPDDVTWHPLVDQPVTWRTWLVWPANSRRRDVANLITALEAAVGDQP